MSLELYLSFLCTTIIQLPLTRQNAQILICGGHWSQHSAASNRRWRPARQATARVAASASRQSQGSGAHHDWCSMSARRSRQAKAGSPTQAVAASAGYPRWSAHSSLRGFWRLGSAGSAARATGGCPSTSSESWRARAHSASCRP